MDIYLLLFYFMIIMGFNIGLFLMLFFYLNVVGISDGIWFIGVSLFNFNMLFFLLGFGVVGNGE